MTTAHFFTVHSDIGAGKYGTTSGVDFLSKHLKNKYPDAPISKIYPAQTGTSTRYASAKNAEYLVPFFKDTLTPTITKGLHACQTNNTFPVVISGDHSNAIGIISGFLNHHKDKRVGVVWIDAHADMHSVYTTPSGNIHGMPLSALMRLDNIECQLAPIGDEVKDHWETLKNLSYHPTGVRPSDVFFLGLRSYEPPEKHLIDKHGIFAYSADEHTANFDTVLDELAKRLSELDVVYVSFDVDALDSSLIPATGTPVSEGYQKNQMKAIFDVVLSLPNVRLFEMTEFNPTLDDDTQKYTLITELLEYAIDTIDNRHHQ